MENIIEECAELKFENNAEIKFMYKNCDESQFAARDSELAQVKTDMENLKNKKVGEAKERLQLLKEQLREEKQRQLKELK